MMFRVAPPTLGAPTFSGIKLPKTTAGIKDFISQGRMMPQLQRTIASANLADAMLMESAAPGMVAATQAYGRTASSMAQGLIPADVQQNLTRNTAFSSLNTGIGSDSSAGRNLMARDLGLTSLQMQQGSQGFMDAAMKSASFLAPNRMSAGLISASDYQKRRDEAAAIQAQIQNQQSIANTSMSNQNALMQWAYNNSKK
jgi:hypothetical protein